VTASPYCRLFGEDTRSPPDAEALVRLGAAMSREHAPARGFGDSRIPAGYTYFGQFIAHDVSFDMSKGLPESFVTPAATMNARTRGLALDSLYGTGPAGRDRRLYADDGVRMRLCPLPAPGSDLPRRADGCAVIADERNDETVSIAQMQVCLMSFHNRVADRLDAARPAGGARFEDVRNVVVQHVLSVVLYDFLWRLVPDEVYFDVFDHGRRLFYPDGVPCGYPLALPVEFTHAAFRFGHSMVRASYRWNRTIEFATLCDLLKNTHRNGDATFRRLHPDWVIDWRNFIDFSGRAGMRARKDINFARKIDTLLTDLLGALPPGERKHGEPPGLATRDLLRSRVLKLPCGQDAAKECYRRCGLYVGQLGPGDFARIRDQTVRSAIQRYGFDEHTPLWVYVLAEAELEAAGERLGRLGGRIVMEVIHALIEASEPSILPGRGWRSSLPSQRPDVFLLPDLVAFSGLVPGLG
jgi:hypothetical protein